MERTDVERISVVITGKCDVSCFGSYLINIFLKSRKAEREREREDMLKQGNYCLSVTVQDLDLQQWYRYEEINI